MTEYKSAARAIPYANTQVYAMLADLSNLKKVEGILTERGVKNLVCDVDSCSMTLDAAGTLDFSVVEREPDSRIKLQATKAGIPIVMTIELTPVAPKETSMQLSASIGMDSFMASMVAGPLKEVLNKTSEALASLSYE